MRIFVVLAVLLFLVTSCSNSRTVDAEMVVAPGSHVSRTVMGSDVLIPKGAVLDVSYSSSSRFFMGSGGALTGFQKGARNTRIYAEEGATLPEPKFLSGVSVKTVSSARKAYQNRFKELPPLTSQPQVGGGVTVHSGDDDSWDDDCFDDPDRSSRAVSVKPDSYRSKD